jgi:hypothetical protein
VWEPASAKLLVEMASWYVEVPVSVATDELERGLTVGSVLVTVIG